MTFDALAFSDWLYANSGTVLMVSIGLAFSLMVWTATTLEWRRK